MVKQHLSQEESLTEDNFFHTTAQSILIEIGIFNTLSTSKQLGYNTQRSQVDTFVFKEQLKLSRVFTQKGGL